MPEPPKTVPWRRRRAWLYFGVAVVILAVLAYAGRRTLEEALIYALSRPHYEDVRIGGVKARIYFPAERAAQPLPAIIYFHGNGQRHDLFLGYEALAAIGRGRHLFALIDGQDFVTPPFSSAASGWGNDIYRMRYSRLYDYLVEVHHIQPKVDVIGASMGGIAMGRFIVDRSMPIGRAFGLGPVPSIRSVFDRGGDRRRKPIRNAFAMAADGSDDDRLRQFAADAFWFEDLSSGARLPDLRILAGTADRTFRVEFDGERGYADLCAVYRRSGGLCNYELVGGVGHADRSMLVTVLHLIDN